MYTGHSRMTATKKIKLMHMVNHLTLTGMEYGVIKLLNKLPSDMYEKHICVLSKVYPGVGELVSKDISIVELKRNPGFDLKIINPIKNYINKNGIEILHSHNWATLPFAVILKMISSAKYLIHGEHGRESVTWKMSRLQKLFIKIFKHQIFLP